MPFNVKLFGYDRQQVDAAIEKLTFDAADAAHNADRLNAELERQRLQTDELRRDHDQLSRALVSAHKAAQEIRDAAEVSAQAIIREARQRADTMLHDAEEAVKVIEAEIATLAARRRDAEAAYETFVQSIVRAYEHARASGKSSLTALP